jgi:hypothetical protein
MLYDADISEAAAQQAAVYWAMLLGIGVGACLVLVVG